MADINKSLHLKNLTRNAAAADPENPYSNWSPPTISRAAKTAAPAAPAADDDRLDQINKAFSPAGSEDAFGGNDLFDTEDANSADPFLAYARKGDSQGARPVPNQAFAAAPESDPVFAEETGDSPTDSIFAAPAADAAGHSEERAAPSYAAFPPSPEQPENGQFESSAAGDGDEADSGENGEALAEPVPPQSTAPLPFEDAGTAPPEAATADTAAEDYQASGEEFAADPAQLSVTARFSKPAQFMGAPADSAGAPQEQTAVPEEQTAAPEEQTAVPEEQTAVPEESAAPTLTLSSGQAAAEERTDPDADGSDSETAASGESADLYGPLPAAEAGTFRSDPPPEPQIASGSALQEIAEGAQHEEGDWGGLVQASSEESAAADALADGGDVSVDFSEELDTLKTQVDSLITSYNQINKENSELKHQYAEAEETIRRYADDCQRLRLENEQIKPLRALNRELQEEVADVQREKRHYEGMVRNIRNKNREAASAMHKMIVRLGDLDSSS